MAVPVIVTAGHPSRVRADCDEAAGGSDPSGITNGVILHRNWGNMKGVYHLHTAAKHGLDVLAIANQLAERSEVKFAERT